MEGHSEESDTANENFDETQSKFDEKNDALSRIMEENDRIDWGPEEEMEKLQRIAWVNQLRFLEETANLKSEIDRKREEVDEWARRVEQEQLTIWEKIEFEEEKEQSYESLFLASETQLTVANEAARLIEKQQREKHEALEKLLKLKRKMDCKLQLEWEIEELKGQLRVLEFMGSGGNDEEMQKKMPGMEEELKEKVKALEEYNI